MNNNHFWRTFMLSAALAGLSLVANAQSFNSSITGLVTDPSNAPIPGAELSLTSVQTAAVSGFTTGGTGCTVLGTWGAARMT